MTELEPLVRDVRANGHAADPPSVQPPVTSQRRLPTASVFVDGRGAAVAVDAAWATLTGQPSKSALGRGWQRALDPARRAGLVNQIVRNRMADHSDCRVLTSDGHRWMRFWWRETEGAVVEVTLVDIDDLWQRAAHDPLTGLMNRREFLVAIDEALQRGRGSGEFPAVLFVDLDGFKQVNDSHGHQAGDRVLADVAARIAGAVRPSDAVGRVGGDEFAVLCDRPCSPAAATALAERIERSVGDAIVGPAHDLSATTGFARGMFADSGETVLARADHAMYSTRALRVRQTTSGVTPATAGRSSGLDDAEAVVDLATVVVHRLFGIGLTLQAAASVADEETQSRLHTAVEDLDGLINDVRLSVFITLPAVATTDGPAGTIDLLRHALGAAVQELHDEWVAAAVDPLAPGGHRDRLVRAALHVRAAARALEPGTLV